MDNLVITDEQEIQAIMDDVGTTRYVALSMLGLLPGDVFGDGDLFRLRRLTDVKRRRLGLGSDEEPLPAEHRPRTAYVPDDLTVASRHLDRRGARAGDEQAGDS